MRVDDEQVLWITCLVCRERFAFSVPTDVLLDAVQVETPYAKERDGSSRDQA